MAWKVRCTSCGTVWTTNISFDISKQKYLYHYCKVCRRNTFNEILEYIE
ncbi:MAG: hypothetical protein JZD40_05960 [Sulfolobus sp.]|nr:hypothetical protein [Sulfolobus sp.]